MADIKAEITAHVEGFRLYHEAVAQVLTSVQGPVARDLARRAILVESAAKINASSSHRPAPAGSYGGSAPGQGPAVRTGRLRGSITWRFAGTSGYEALMGGGLTVEIGTNVEYAEYLERGTSRMAARPFLLPALAAAAG